jgi:hypothetical protein
MYMSDLRHIHDPVLSSLKMEGIRLLFFLLLAASYRFISLVSVAHIFQDTVNGHKKEQRFQTVRSGSVYLSNSLAA